MTEQDLNDVIAGFREALRDYVKGDPEPAMSFFSDWDDVTLANPLEPPRRGPAEVGEAGPEGGGQLPRRRLTRSSVPGNGEEPTIQFGTCLLIGLQQHTRRRRH